MITKIKKPDNIPQEGIAVVTILIDVRAPCKKYLNNFRNAIGLLENEKNPLGAQYFWLMWSEEVKNYYNLHGMPTTYVFVDGEIKKTWVGHFWSHFEIAEYVKQGIVK